MRTHDIHICIICLVWNELLEVNGETVVINEEKKNSHKFSWHDQMTFSPLHGHTKDRTKMPACFYVVCKIESFNYVGWRLIPETYRSRVRRKCVYFNCIRGNLKFRNYFKSAQLLCDEYQVDMLSKYYGCSVIVSPSSSPTPRHEIKEKCLHFILHISLYLYFFIPSCWPWSLIFRVLL